MRTKLDIDTFMGYLTCYH